MLGALAKIASKTADIGKELLKGLLGGQKIPKGHQATEPIDYAAIDSSTKILGAIFMAMQRARTEELAARADSEKEHKDNIKDENTRNEELIKALTVRRKPKKKKAPPKEAPKREPTKEKPKPEPKAKEPEKAVKPKEAPKPKEVTPKAEKVTVKEAPAPKAEAIKPPPKEAPPKAEPAAPKPSAPKPSAEKAPGIGEKVAQGVALGTAATGAGVIVSALTEAGLSQKAQANVLAQVKAESNFKPQSENLKYTKAEGIANTFGKTRIPSVEFAQQFVNNPEALANHVYAKTDGNSEPGDGWKYRGRGYLQHTGKNQYVAIKKYTGVDVVSNPDLLNDPAVASKAVAWFFLDYKKKKPEQLENISEVNKAVGFADKRLKSGEMESEHRAKLAQEFAAGIPSNQTLPASLTPNTGTKIDQASKENKDMKESAATAKKQQTVNNTTVNQTNTQSASASDSPDYDDRNPYQKKKG
jgi:putative chitinase